MHSHGHDVFLNGNGILKITFTIEKLLQMYLEIVDDFTLRFQLSCKNDIAVFIAHNRNGTLAKSVGVNAVAGSAIFASLHDCASRCLQNFADD